jgi:hypothetical protein
MIAAGHTSKPNSNRKGRMATVDSEARVGRVTAAAEVFVYGYPLVYSLRETAGFAEGHSSLPVSAPCDAGKRSRANGVQTASLRPT